MWMMSKRTKKCWIIAALWLLAFVTLWVHGGIEVALAVLVMAWAGDMMQEMRHILFDDERDEDP